MRAQFLVVDTRSVETAIIRGQNMQIYLSDVKSKCQRQNDWYRLSELMPDRSYRH